MQKGNSQFANLDYPYQDHLVDLQAGFIYSLSDRMFKRRLKIEHRRYYPQDESEAFTYEENSKCLFIDKNFIHTF